MKVTTNKMSEFPDYAYILFDDICNIIGPSDEWPEGILKLFWSRNVKHWDCFMLCTFVAVNGLNPKVFLEWVDVIQMARCSHSLHEIKSLLKQFTENSDKWSRVYGYHVLNHRYEFVNRKVKCYYSMSKKRPHWYVLLYSCSHLNR